MTAVVCECLSEFVVGKYSRKYCVYKLAKVIYWMSAVILGWVGD